jgi:putative SOS response-associated peptidase YedK
MRKVQIVDDPAAQRCWIAIDLKSREPMLRLHDRELLERICSSLEWKIVPPVAQRSLIPGWWNKPLREMKLATFNARSDSVADKPIFAESFAKRRCLIPASGYYEWVTTPGGKQPYYFTRRDRQIITIAGIQDGWTDPDSRERLRSCAMVITDANKFMADIHDRMPVILEPKDFEQWERGNVKDAAALMKPADDDLLNKRPVSRRVNSSRADGSDGTRIEAV